MGGLHDDGNIEAGLAHARQHAEAVEVGHHQVEHHAIDTLRPAEQGESRVAAFGDQGLIAEALDHGFEQPALDWIVVDDKHCFGHENSDARRLCRFGAMSLFRLNGLLNAPEAA